MIYCSQTIKFLIENNKSKTKSRINRKKIIEIHFGNDYFLFPKLILSSLSYIKLLQQLKARRFSLKRESN